MDLKEKIKYFPETPGVYIMKDSSGKILYIGKAVSLKKRVSSYFQRAKNNSFKTSLLMKRVYDISYIMSKSEAQALIMEASLIKKHQPKYNVELRDSKSYPFIKITKERFPTVLITRERKKPNAIYYGPYTNVKLLRQALVFLRRIFPYRTCKIYKRKKACLDYHIGLCPGVCLGEISSKEYSKNIKNLRLVLEGRNQELWDSLYEEMRVASQEEKFEDAANLRDKIQALGQLYFESKVRNYLQESLGLKELLRLPRLPERIEAFDISNIFGKEAVGSMVSFYKGKADKNNHRRFRIKGTFSTDDYSMLAEITRRRYTRLKAERKPLPDLVVIDGGKGQVNSVQKELSKLGLYIPVIGIAKQYEELYLPTRNRPLSLPQDSPALQLIQRVRDEAHRFALKYHHVLRRKKTFAEK